MQSVACDKQVPASRWSRFTQCKAVECCRKVKTLLARHLCLIYFSSHHNVTAISRGSVSSHKTFIRKLHPNTTLQAATQSSTDNNNTATLRQAPQQDVTAAAYIGGKCLDSRLSKDPAAQQHQILLGSSWTEELVLCWHNFGCQPAGVWWVMANRQLSTVPTTWWRRLRVTLSWQSTNSKQVRCQHPYAYVSEREQMCTYDALWSLWHSNKSAHFFETGPQKG